MDRLLRKEIRVDVMAAMQTAMMQMDERWISAQELCNQFQMFTKDWVEKYGDILPHKRIKVTHLNGKTRKTRVTYPQHEIAINISEGLYDDLKLLR